MTTTREELAGRVRALSVEAGVAGLEAEAALLAETAGALAQSGLVLLGAGGLEERCRSCGCTEERACPGGCAWVEPGLCSACVPAGDW